MTTLPRTNLGGMTAVAATMAALPAVAGNITVLNVADSQGYQFTKLDGPTPNGGGTTMNEISTNGFQVQPEFRDEQRRQGYGDRRSDDSDGSGRTRVGGCKRPTGWPRRPAVQDEASLTHHEAWLAEV